MKAYLALLAPLLCARAAIAQEPPSRGVLEVTAALVREQLEVRPVPLLQLLLVVASDSSNRRQLQTSLDGHATIEVPAGSYRLLSPQPVRFEGRSYRWDVPVTVVNRATTRVELTNANATAEASPTLAPGRQLAPEAEVYSRVRRGVIRVDAGGGHGSGFFVAGADRLILTNDHVVAGATPREISVTIDSVTRVPAIVVAKDRDADLAVLRVAADACRDCPGLALAAGDSTDQVVLPGERVLAVGFPLSQRSTLTSGIVSSVRSGAVISDVNINPGNSGGPLLNLAGEVIGVNTFAEQTAGRGAGVSGSVSVVRARTLLRRANDTLRFLPTPVSRRLPTQMLQAFPLAMLRALADTANERAYRSFSDLDVGNFAVAVITPVSRFVEQRLFDESIARDRRRREALAGVPAEERYSSLLGVRDWIEYVGAETTPAVSITVAPKIGETTGSAIARGLVAGFGARYQPLPAARMVFKGDVQWARFFRDGREVEPVRGGRTPVQVYENNAWVVMRDVAYRGFYVFRPEVFEPDSAGRPPSIVMVVRDLKHLDDTNADEFPPELVARVWNDFLPFMRQAFPERRWVRAEPRLFRSQIDDFCRTHDCS